jgi:hypothetical protein
MRVALIAAALSLATGSSALAIAQPRSESSYVPVTATERRQTRPLVDLVLAAHKSGDFSSLCAVWSQQLIRDTFGTRARCRTETRRQPLRPCKTCTFGIRRVLGLYKTAGDRKQRRKTVVWLVPVKGDPRLRGGSLEVRCIQEQGRWVVTGVLQDGLAPGG